MERKHGTLTWNFNMEPKHGTLTWNSLENLVPVTSQLIYSKEMSEMPENPHRGPSGSTRIIPQVYQVSKYSNCS